MLRALASVSEPMMSRSSNLSDVTAQFLSSVAGRGCYLLLQVFLARSLAPHAFGLYAIGWTVVGLVSTLTPIGMPQAVLRYNIAGQRALFTSPIAITAAVGMIGCAVVMASAEVLARKVFGDLAAAPAIMTLAPSIPLIGIFWLLASALRASGANLSSALLGTLLFVLYLATTALAFAIGMSRTPSTVGLTYTISIALSLLPAMWLLYRLPATVEMPGMRGLLRFGVVTMFISSANLLNLWADRIIIGIMADTEAVGIYQVASQLAVVAIVLRAAVVTVFEARVPKPLLGAAPPDITREFVAASRILLHLSAPGLTCLCLTAGFWVGLLFGPAYQAAALPLVILVLGQLALTFTGPAVNALHMTGDENMAMWLTTGICVLNVAGNLFLIPLLGLSGSAFASGLAILTVGIVSLWQLRRSGRLQPYFRRLLDVAFGTMASFVATLSTVQLLGGSLTAMLASVVVAYLAYAAIVLLMCRGEDEAVTFIRLLWHRLRRWRVSAQ
ncbi:MAG: oligosaccharide flippase family protein [Janthinobacterium lividum]